MLRLDLGTIQKYGRARMPPSFSAVKNAVQFARALREREIPNFAYLTISPKGNAHRAVLPSGRYLRPAQYKGPPIQVRAAAFGLGGHDPRSVKTVVKQ